MLDVGEEIDKYILYSYWCCDVEKLKRSACLFMNLKISAAHRVSAFHCSSTPTRQSLTMGNDKGAGVIQPGIFEDLQKKIDEDTAVKDVNTCNVV